MNWDQNEELVEQILRTGMYAKLYDEETIYGYLTYLTYRVEDALFTWKKESDVDGFWADLTWEEYTAFLQREKSLVLAAQRAVSYTHLVSKPSVCHAVSTLKEGGFLTMDENSFLFLTDVGREVAEQTYEKHCFFTRQLVAAGVDPQTAEREACRMEHSISPVSYTHLPGWIFTQEQIYEAVWHEFPEDCGAAVVNIISQLRRKMGPGNPIRTVPHSGYKFELPSAD